MRRSFLLLVAGLALVGAVRPVAAAEGEQRAILVNAVVAEVNNQAITLHEVLKVAETPVAELRQQYSGGELRQRVQALLRVMVWQLINKALLVEEAERQLTEREKQQAQLTVDRIIKDMIGIAGTLVNLRQQLEQLGLTVEQERRRRTERQMVQMLLDREVRSLARVRAEEIRQYYLEHREEYHQPKKVRIRQILIRYGEHESKEAARQTAEQVLEKLRAGGDFAYLATVYSDGPYAREGGLWDFIEQGQFVEAVDRVAFSLPRGGVSSVIEGPTGYHIIRVEDVTSERTAPFEEVQDQIQQKLYRQSYEERRDHYIKHLQSGARIRTYDQYLQVALEQILASGPPFDRLTPRPSSPTSTPSTTQAPTPAPPTVELER